MASILFTHLSIFFITFSLAGLVVCSGKWSYQSPDGPSTWQSTYPKCGGNRQSPVNIPTNKGEFYGAFKDLDIQYSLADVNVTNNGKAITVKLSASDNLYFTGADFKSAFVLDQFHFHIGSDSSQGSEHQIDGKVYPMEMHLVHFNATKATAIMSVLFTQQERDNPYLNTLTDSLQNCTYRNDSTHILSFSVQDLLPKDITKFYRYSGSYTTPDCSNAEWIVFHQTSPISSKQLQKFRSVFANSKQDTRARSLVNNFRPLQPLNGRIVLRNFDHLRFICGKKTSLSADCRKTIEGHDVFYEVQVNPCTLPVSVVLKISVVGLGFSFEKTITEDMATPVTISNLKYGASVEMHFHTGGSNAGQLHVTVKQFPLSKVTNTSKVIDQYFQVEGVCQRSNCTADTQNTHWCTSYIGVDNPLLIGFSSKLTDPCGSPTTEVVVYRSEYMKQTWIMTAKQEFKDKQTYLVNLTRSLVDGKNLRMRKAVNMATKWTAVSLEAHIDQISDVKTNFSVYLIVKSNGGHYLVFNTQYKYSNGYCNKSSSGGHGKKVAIGVIIVVVLILVIGVAAFLLYRNRRNYFGHRPALVDEIEVQDTDHDRL